MVLVTEDLKLAKCDRGFYVTVTQDQLKAYLKIEQAEIGDKEITVDDIIRNLNAACITFGIDRAKVEEIVAQKSFAEKHLVASGQPPEPGRSAELQLCFEQNHKIAPKEGADGRIDYRDMDFLQNAEPGQVLVKKIPAQPGKPGMTVTGLEIAPKPGKDKKIPVGANTSLSPDGLTLAATASGTIVYAGSAVSVQPMTNISGSIDLTTGNINCKGSLRVGKDIKSDFKVEVSGDLEVAGNVEDAEINCKGNVVVKGGFVGRGDGYIKAEGNVTLKYVINQTVIAGGNIYIGGEVVSANLSAHDEIRVLGTKGKVVGGTLTARRLIIAETLGADAGTKTVLKVAYDAKLMEQIKNVANEITRLKSDGERVKASLVDLYKLKMAGKLPAAKEPVMAKLEEFNKTLPTQLEDLKHQQEQLEKKATEVKNAKVIAEKEAFPGVQVHIGIKYKELDQVRGPSLFEMYNDSILTSPFDRKAFEAQERQRKKEEDAARKAQ